jgi:hypothetical protein
MRPLHRPSRPIARHLRRGVGARLWPALLLASLALVSVCGSTALADSADDRRVRAGARLFRSLLTAQLALENKTAKDGSLHVVVFGSDSGLTPEVGDLIATSGDSGKSGIRDLPVAIERVTSVAQLAKVQQPAGVFLVAAQSPTDLQQLIRWSTDAHVVLYSPFEGDVEQGVAAGLAVEAKVQPYLNTSALQAAGVEIKPFYLKVAKVYP